MRMSRIGAYALFTLGWFLIFLSLLLYFYATPRVEKAPYDVYERTVSVGSGSYFSPRKLTPVGPVSLQNISIAKGDPARSTHAVAVVNIFSRTVDTTNGQDIDISNDVYAFDRNTGYGVRCCGAKPVASGVTLKFPFDTKRGTYPFWDSTARRAFPARYVRTETVEGMSADVFVSDVPPTRLGTLSLPGFLVGRSDQKTVSAARFYRATTTLWVEPTTGAILKAGQASKHWVADDRGAPLLVLADVNVINDRPSVRSVVDQVKSRVWLLKLVSRWLPVAGPVLGVILIGLWFLLMRRSDRRRVLVVGDQPPPATAEPAEEVAGAMVPGAAEAPASD